MSNQLYRIAVTLSSHDSVIRNHKNCSGLNSPLAPEWTRIKEFASHTLRYLSQLDFQSALFRSTMISGGASENTQVKQACQGAFFTFLPGDTNGPRGPLPYPSPSISQGESNSNGTRSGTQGGQRNHSLPSTIRAAGDSHRAKHTRQRTAPNKKAPTSRRDPFTIHAP